MASNPYSPPESGDALDHRWGSRTISVTARFPRSHLWIFAQVLVKVDDVLVAHSIFLWSFDKQLVFRFEHEGQSVPCRLRTRQTMGSMLSLTYDLSINDGPSVSRRVPIRGTVLNALAVAFVIILGALSGLFWLFLYAIS